MRKRLRRKLHRHEFAKWICNPDVLLADADVMDGFTDGLIDAVEATGSTVMWASGGNAIGGVLLLRGTRQDAMAELDSIKTWVDSQPEVMQCQMGGMESALRSLQDMASE